MEFTLGESEHVFQHEWQAMDSDSVPIILGNDFWSRHKATFDFETRTISMVAGTRRIVIPFTVGDEHEKEQAKGLCSMVDIVVPPRTAYLLPTLPRGSDGQPARLLKGARDMATAAAVRCGGSPAATGGHRHRAADLSGGRGSGGNQSKRPPAHSRHEMYVVGEAG